MSQHSSSEERAGVADSRHRHKREREELTEEQISKRSILVSNIPVTMKKKHLIAGFSVIGHIADIQMSVYNAEEGASGGSECLITYDKPMHAIQAVTCLNNHLTHGSQISVSLVHSSKKADPSESESMNHHVLILENVQKEVTVDHIMSLFSVFGVIESCKLLRDGVMRVSFTTSDSAERAIHAMNNFSLKGSHLQIAFEEDFVSRDLRAKPNQPSQPVPQSQKGEEIEAVGFVDYAKPRKNRENEAILNSCIVLVTGFSEGDDLRDAQNILELKRIATEQGKVGSVDAVCSDQGHEVRGNQQGKESVLSIRKLVYSVYRCYRV